MATSALPAHALGHSYLDARPFPVVGGLAHSPVDAVLPRVVLVLLVGGGAGRPLPRVGGALLLVDAHACPRKDVALLLGVVGEGGLGGGGLLGLNVVEGRGEVDVDVGVDDADGVVLVAGLDLEDVDEEAVLEDLDGDGVALVEAGEVAQLVLQHGLGVVEVDELGLVRLQLDHVPHVAVLLLHVGDQGHGGGRPGLGELEHLEHPVGDVAEPLLGHELQHPAVGHAVAVLEAEDEGVLVAGVEQRVQLVERRGGQQDLVALLDVLPEREGRRVDPQSECTGEYSWKKLMARGPPGRWFDTFCPPIMPENRFISVMIIGCCLKRSQIAPTDQDSSYPFHSHLISCLAFSRRGRLPFQQGLAAFGAEDGRTGQEAVEAAVDEALAGGLAVVVELFHEGVGGLEGGLADVVVPLVAVQLAEDRADHGLLAVPGVEVARPEGVVLAELPDAVGGGVAAVGRAVVAELDGFGVGGALGFGGDRCQLEYFLLPLEAFVSHVRTIRLFLITSSYLHLLLDLPLSLPLPFQPSSALLCLLPWFEGIRIKVIIVQMQLSEVMDLSKIDDQQMAVAMVDMFQDIAQGEKGFRKESAQEFFKMCLNNIESQKVDPRTKFLTIYMLKELTYKGKFTTSLFGVMTGHGLFVKLEELAVRTDPNKALGEKGKKLFAGSPQEGNDFIRIVLESVVAWAQRYPSNSKKEPTRFKKLYLKLAEAGVTMPKSTDFKFYEGAARKPDRSETPGGTVVASSNPPKDSSNPYTATGASKVQETPGGPGGSGVGKESKGKHASEIKFMHDKIISLLEILEDATDPEEVQREAASYHAKFEKDKEKLQRQEAEMIDGQEQEIVQLYFSVADFLEEERRIYSTHAANNDYASYVAAMTHAYDEIFQDQASKRSKKSRSKIESPPKPKPPREEAKPPMHSMPPKERSKTEAPAQGYKSSKAEEPYGREKEEGSYGRKEPSKSSHNPSGNNHVEVFFSRLREPALKNGFQALAVSLGKEKQSKIAPRPKNMYASTFTRSRFDGGASLARSKLKGLFAAPPNPTVNLKKYEGELVMESHELDRTVGGVRKEQGLRRLKVSMFRAKYLVYEDEFLQVGFKSTPVYERVAKFSALLNLELFFGNKTTKDLRDFRVSFQGDRQSYLYQTPEEVEEVVPTGSQNRVEILSIPKAIPYNLVSTTISFSCGGEERSVRLLLPTSILQMAAYRRVPAEEWGERWASCSKLIKSDSVRLSRHFPPDELTHLIPELSERTSYREFSSQGSTMDYVLSCEVTVQQRYEGLLNVAVRPNMTVVVQVGTWVDDSTTGATMRFYLQSLLAVLREYD